MIQKFTIYLALTFISMSTFGQVQVDPRIQEFLGEEIIRKIITEHPKQIEYYNNILNNSFQFVNEEDIKTKVELNFETIANLPLKNGTKLSYSDLEQQINNGTFNIFQINLRRNKSIDRYFKIGNGTKIFVLIAEEKLKQ